MDDQVVKKTQDTLGKVIKKPPLTEKLLNKPPFRFLHDIVTSVIKTTGFMKGLFADNELQSDNVKEKDAKMAFLQKVIDIVQLATGQNLTVKTSKIVAGHEPEKTNELLQALAAAISKKSNNDDLVQKVLKGETGPSSKKDRDSSADRRDKSAVKKEKDGEKRSKDNKDRDRSKDRERDKENRDESRSKRQGEKGSNDSGKDKADKKEKVVKAEEKPPKSERTSNKENGHVQQEPEKADGSDDDDDEDGSSAKIPRPSSAKGSRRRQREEEKRKRGEANEDKEDSQEPPVPIQRQQRSARPSSARPAPPKPKKQQEAVPEPEIRIGSGKRVAQVIIDNAQNSDDDDDNFMVEDGAPAEPPPEAPAREMNGEPEQDDGEHGGLVKKILETKKELEGGSQQPQAKKVEIEKPAVSDAARRKEREMVMKEIDKLRESIQTLTRSANPLGKIMDYVQEDMDSMQKELEKWKQENKEHAQALKREQSVTESSIEPLKGQMAELDQAISDQLMLIAASKANINRNDSKISKMLGSVTKS